jgi:hypothetical protein
MRAWTAMTLLVLSACPDVPDDVCPSDLPPSCVMPPPSWATDVSPVVARTCSGCHGPSGIEASRPYGTWSEVDARKTDVLFQVYGCLMPLPDAGVTLSATDRAVLLHWLVCGAPNN